MIAGLLLISLLPLARTDVPSRMTSRLEQEVRNEMKEQRLDLLSKSGTRSSLAKTLTTILSDEMTAAWDDYYQFRWKRAARWLSGRADPEALAFKALLEQAQGASPETKLYGLHRMAPDYVLDQKKFPPSFIRLWNEVKSRTTSGAERGPPQLGPLKVDEDRLRDSRERLARLAQREGWDEVIVIGIVPSGWNWRIFGWKIPCRISDDDSWVEAVLMKDADLASGAKMIVRGLKVVDTPAVLE